MSKCNYNECGLRKEIEQKMKEETSKANEVKVEEIGYCPQCPECCGYCEKRRRKYE